MTGNVQTVQQVRIMDRSYVVPVEDVEPLRAFLPEGYFSALTDPYRDCLTSLSAKAAWDYANLVYNMIGD